MKPVILLAALGLLAACATPKEQCISKATADLRVVDMLIAQSRATLERGYALETRRYPDMTFQFCKTDEGDSYVCTQHRTRTETVPVAVNLDDERAKLATLEEKRRELAARAQRELAACEAAYPEG